MNYIHTPTQAFREQVEQEKAIFGYIFLAAAVSFILGALFIWLATPTSQQIRDSHILELCGECYSDLPAAPHAYCKLANTKFICTKQGWIEL